MKKIYVDFETTHTNPILANILEACFLFVGKNNIVKKFHAKIKVNKEWNDFNKKEIETLDFNNICTEEEYIKHQKEAVEFEFYINEVIEYYIQMFQDIEEDGKPIKLPLTGWNNAGFDNIILKQAVMKLPVFEHSINIFDYHTRDIMHRFQILKECDMLKGLSLSKAHGDVIGTIPFYEFHNSNVDCIATKDLDEWFEEHIMKEIKK
jgi:hypothetical protein